ncbi:MAG TPA: sortase [Thermomicrobiales bacterium]|jgi:LPXTG-site transpeptidase (sortase) family protein|nr:sortase [Thermomicrobiales bacterium]
MTLNWERVRNGLASALVATSLMVSVAAVPAMASTGTALPGWGDNADKGLQAGPLGVNAASQGSSGVVPIAMQIPDAGVDAEVEKNKIVDGQMLDPSGPWVVSWYQETAKAGDTKDYRNMVVSGHVDYWGVGPSVFQSVSGLAQGAQIFVTGENGDVFTYAVDSVEMVDANPTQEVLQQIVGPSDKPTLTIITCGGDFNGSEYLNRIIVKAHLVESEESAATPGTPTSATDNTGVTALTSGSTAVAKDDSVNVRSDAATTADIVTTLNKGDEVTITGDSVDADGHTWYPVELADGTTGWVVQDYLAPAQ